MFRARITFRVTTSTYYSWVSPAKTQLALGVWRDCRDIGWVLHSGVGDIRQVTGRLSSRGVGAGRGMGRLGGDVHKMGRIRGTIRSSVLRHRGRHSPSLTVRSLWLAVTGMRASGGGSSCMLGTMGGRTCTGTVCIWGPGGTTCLRLDVFKARDAKAWQREFPVGFPVKTLCFKLIIHQRFSRFCCLYRKQMRD